MRRGTEPAIEFGAWLRDCRMKAGVSMKQVALAIGTATAAVSQIEKGQRAFKNDAWIEPWATTIGFGVRPFRAVKEEYDAVPVGAVFRRRGRSTKVSVLDSLISELSGQERSRVQGYIEAIIESRGEK